MKSGGLVLVIVGAWVVSQVLGGNALGRLGITGADTAAGTDTGPDIIAPGPPGGGTGVPYIPPGG